MPEAESKELSEVKRREGRQLSWAPKETGHRSTAPSGEPGKASCPLHALVSGVLGKATISPDRPRHPVINNSLPPGQSGCTLSAWHSQGHCRLSRAAVPNPSGTRDQFRGRQFFMGAVGNGFGMIQVHYIYCVLHFCCYHISSTSDHQALDPGGWGPLL